MSKKRQVAKYGAAVVATGLYGAAVANSYQQRKKGAPADLPQARQVALAAGLMVGLTWLAAAL